MLFLASSAIAAEFEFIAYFAYDRPDHKPLPGLTDGFGFGFSAGFSPFKTWGISVAAASTKHDLDGGISGNRLITVDSRRNAIFFQGHYRFLRLRRTCFEGCFGATYNRINGGDSSGSYLDSNIEPEDVGYSGWGIAIGLNVKHPIQSGYFLFLGIKYNLLTYTTHKIQNIEFSESEHHRKANSLMINIGVAYKLDFSRF